MTDPPRQLGSNRRHPPRKSAHRTSGRAAGANVASFLPRASSPCTSVFCLLCVDHASSALLPICPSASKRMGSWPGPLAGFAGRQRGCDLQHHDPRPACAKSPVPARKDDSHKLAPSPYGRKGIARSHKQCRRAVGAHHLVGVEATLSVDRGRIQPGDWRQSSYSSHNPGGFCAAFSALWERRRLLTCVAIVSSNPHRPGAATGIVGASACGRARRITVACPASTGSLHHSGHAAKGTRAWRLRSTAAVVGANDLALPPLRSSPCPIFAVAYELHILLTQHCTVHSASGRSQMARTVNPIRLAMHVHRSLGIGASSAATVSHCRSVQRIILFFLTVNLDGASLPRCDNRGSARLHAHAASRRLPNGIHRLRVFQAGQVAQRLVEIGGADDAVHHFGAARLGQGRGKTNVAGAAACPIQPSPTVEQLLTQRIISLAGTGLQHTEGDHFLIFDRVRYANRRRLDHRRSAR